MYSFIGFSTIPTSYLRYIKTKTRTYAPIGNSAHGNHRVEYDAPIYSHGKRDGSRFFLRAVYTS